MLRIQLANLSISGGKYIFSGMLKEMVAVMGLNLCVVVLQPVIHEVSVSAPASATNECIYVP